jgi:hypothetical protein
MTGVVGLLAFLLPVAVRAQEAEKAAPPQAGGQELPGPDPIKDAPLGPTLPTVATPRTGKEVNWVKVDTAPLPVERQGIWVLELHFRPVRMVRVDIPGKGRRNVHYLYYRVINRTGKPRMFVPSFTLVTDTGKKKQDTPIPAAVKVIQTREDPLIPLLGDVSIYGLIPPSTKEGIDDAVYGVAVWEGVDPKADRFSVFVQGLSDGFKDVAPSSGGKPVTQHKTLQIDFVRRGDEHDIHEKEIQLLDPPYDWVYR